MRAPLFQEPVLMAEGIAFARGARWLFRGLSMQVSAGDAVAVIGRNGVGKSTLLRSLAGLLSPHAGKVAWSGRNAGALAASERARLVSYMSQSLQAYPGFQVRDFLRLAFSRPLSEGTALSRAEEDELARVARVFELAEFMQRDLVDLSGGEWRRTQLARSLAQPAPLLVLDEPETSLDPGHLRLLVEILSQERARGRALVVSSHRMEFLEGFCNRGLVLEDGLCMWQGPLPGDEWSAVSRAAFGRTS